MGDGGVDGESSSELDEQRESKDESRKREEEAQTMSLGRQENRDKTQGTRPSSSRPAGRSPSCSATSKRNRNMAQTSTRRPSRKPRPTAQWTPAPARQLDPLSSSALAAAPPPGAPMSRGTQVRKGLRHDTLTLSFTVAQRSS